MHRLRNGRIGLGQTAESHGASSGMQEAGRPAQGFDLLLVCWVRVSRLGSGSIEQMM